MIYTRSVISAQLIGYCGGITVENKQVPKRKQVRVPSLDEKLLRLLPSKERLNS